MNSERRIAGAPAEEVEAILRETIRRQPESSAGWRSLGVLLGARGDWKGSAGHLRQAAERAPRDATILADWAVALVSLGKNRDALRVLQRALRLTPGDRQIRVRRADVLWRLGRRRAALEACHALLREDPGYGPALRLRAILQAQAGNYHQALADWTLATGGAQARGEAAFLSGLHWHCGNTHESVAIGRQLLDSGELDAVQHSAYVSARLHTAEETIAGARQAAEEWGRRQAFSCAALPMGHGRTGRRRRPRIGYVTQEFPAGPAIHFVLPLLEQRRRERFTVYGYHVHPRRDAWSWRAARHCDFWREALDLESLARLIREDELDVLVDLSGHYGSALPLWQARHAPVQMTFPNYPGSTGALAVDYILTDRWVCPPGAEQQYTEAPLWLEAGYLPYRPPLTPRLTPPPSVASGYITFGMLQRPSKWNAGTWDAVAEVLRQVPGSRLLVHYSATELDTRGSACRRRIREHVESRGVSGRRLLFRGKVSLAEHMELLAQVDIGLDTFPYAGQTTTSECLWMGVPVISVAGLLHVARVGWQILDRTGVGELAADNAVAYVAKAVELARNPAQLLGYRRNLRRRMRQSPLLNGAVVRGIEEAYLGALKL